MVEMISTPNINEARKLIQKSNSQQIIVKAYSLEFNRKILEHGNFQVLLALEHPLNHVMAKIATKNNIAIGIDIERISRLDKKEKAKTLARIKQNIKTLRKAKTKISLFDFKDEKNARDFLLSLGASTKQAKDII